MNHSHLPAMRQRPLVKSCAFCSGGHRRTVKTPVDPVGGDVPRRHRSAMSGLRNPRPRPCTMPKPALHRASADDAVGDRGRGSARKSTHKTSGATRDHKHDGCSARDPRNCRFIGGYTVREIRDYACDRVSAFIIAVIEYESGGRVLVRSEAVRVR
jgi:hypothetical protein